jgi:hypothetical protein
MWACRVKDGRVLQEGQRLERRPALRLGPEGEPKVAVEMVRELGPVRAEREVREHGVERHSLAVSKVSGWLRSPRPTRPPCR